MADKKSFLLHYDIRVPLESLPDDERGQLFLAVLDYAEKGIIPDYLSPAAMMAWLFIKNGIDADAEAYAEKVEARRAAGKRGGLARAANQELQANQANATFAKQNEQTQANQADTDTVTVTVTDTVTDTVRDNTVSKPAAKKFSPPSLLEVMAYCRERGNDVDAERFLAYYESNGWMVGKNHMKDWQAAVRTWERKNADGRGSFNQPGVPKSRFGDIRGKTYD